MTWPSPAATVVKTVERDVCTVPVCTRCNVCYEFDTSATKRDLALPYCVSLNGKVLEGASTVRKLGASRKITLQAEPGSRIALFLNSDVHPKFRISPVYEVVVGATDVHIKITEKEGHCHEGAVIGMPQHSAAKPGQRGLDYYKAALTGDIWMQISHRYTEAEADAMLPKDMPLEIRDAVLRIYAGLKSIQLQVHIAVKGAAAAMKMNLRFQESENAIKNIKSCSLLRDVLPRTHPHAFATLMTEAYAAGVSDISVTSCWRPMHGSIVHRAGLGLDVVSIASDQQTVKLNRVGLITDKANPNVSKAESFQYSEFVEATKKTRGARSEPEQLLAKNIEDKAKKGWIEELKKSEPSLLRFFRQRLQKHAQVSQIFDPWYMDLNTKDLEKEIINGQFSANEKLHANHLHITIKDSDIL